MKVNIVDVGGEPSFVDFVRTDGGLRLAALVPSLSDAVLVDPGSTVSEVVDLPLPFHVHAADHGGALRSSGGRRCCAALGFWLCHCLLVAREHQ